MNIINGGHKKTSIFLYFLFSLFYSAGLFANDSILTIKGKITDYPVRDYVFVLKDSLKDLDIHQIIKGGYSFQKDHQNLTFGGTEARYWIRFTIQNTCKEKLFLILSIDNPDLNELDFYEVSNDSVTREVHTGQNKVFNSREIENRNYIFRINLEPSKVYTFYIASCNEGDANFVPITLSEQEYFYSNDNKKFLIMGILFGFLIFIVLFNFFLLFQIKERIYLYYSLYVLTFVLYLLCYQGLDYQFFWKNSPWLANHCLILFIALAGFFQILFTQLFLFANKYKVLNHLLNILKVGFVLLVIFSVTSHFFLLVAINMLWFLTPALFLLTIVLSIVALRDKFAPAIYIILASSLTFIGATVFVLKDIGLLPANIFTDKSNEIGIVFEALVLAFAVVDRFRSELNEKNYQLQLNQKELIMAKNKAEESDRLKSAFLANMSHEIRTPMNAILGFSNLLSNPKISDDKKQMFVRIIEQRTVDLLRIINDILDISKLEVGQMKISERPGNLRDMFIQLLEYYESYLANAEEKKPITISSKYNLSMNESLVITDFARLNQILTNLIDNAVKFTEKGSIEFGCFLENEELIFFVKDTGIGIPQDKQGIIFDRFRQVNESTKRVYGGTGLGLSISQGLLNLMSGKIWFKSEENVGTEFMFKIPFRPFDAVSKEEPSGIRPIQVSISKLKILVVEDDSFNVKFIYEILSSRTKASKYINNGQESLDLLQQNADWDLILLDILLPDISGIEIAKQVKRKFPKIKIIAQTAYASEADRDNCLKAGCDDFISKPYNEDQLLAVIKRNLSNVI